MYNEKNLKVMHIICSNSVWVFKYPKETRVPSLVKSRVVRTVNSLVVTVQ